MARQTHGGGYSSGQYLRKGKRVGVLEHRSSPGKGLSYPSFDGVLLEDARVGGWDVVEITKAARTDPVSIYSFSLVPPSRRSADRLVERFQERFEEDVRFGDATAREIQRAAKQVFHPE